MVSLGAVGDGMGVSDHRVVVYLLCDGTVVVVISIFSLLSPTVVVVCATPTGDEDFSPRLGSWFRVV